MPNCTQCGKPSGYNPKNGNPNKLCKVCFQKNSGSNGSRNTKTDFKKSPIKKTKEERLKEAYEKIIYLKGNIMTLEITGGLTRIPVNHRSTVHKYNKDGLKINNNAPWDKPKRHALVITTEERRHDFGLDNALEQDIAYRRVLDLFRQLR